MPQAESSQENMPVAPSSVKSSHRALSSVANDTGLRDKMAQLPCQGRPPRSVPAPRTAARIPRLDLCFH